MYVPADHTADKTITPESQGVEALLAAPLLDALYAYCNEMVGKK